MHNKVEAQRLQHIWDFNVCTEIMFQGKMGMRGLEFCIWSGTFFGLEKYGADRFLAFGPKDCGAGSFFVPNEWRIVFWLEITE